MCVTSVKSIPPVGDKAEKAKVGVMISQVPQPILWFTIQLGNLAGVMEVGWVPQPTSASDILSSWET